MKDVADKYDMDLDDLLSNVELAARGGESPGTSVNEEAS